MSWLTGQHKCHSSNMENVTLTPKEQTWLKVLNRLLAGDDFRNLCMSGIITSAGTALSYSGYCTGGKFSGGLE